MATYDVNTNALFVLYLLCLRLIHGFLNVEEVNSVHYAIDILNKPVLSGQLASGSVMYLKSRYGQQYQCNLPEINLNSEELHSHDDSTIGVEENDIAELLRPLENAPCLIKMKDWWTYEFCYGKYVRQYHIEDNKKTGPDILLGLYESEYDWKNDSEHEMNNRNRLQRYHSQYYVNGSKCEVTGNLRRAEVRFLCEEGSGNYVAKVDEPESCRYVLTVHTSHVCHHPYLRPAPTNKPHPVTCNPVLSPEQYEQYLFQEEAATKAAEESRQRWIAKQEQQLEEMRKKMESEKNDAEKKSEKDDESPLIDESEKAVDNNADGINFVSDAIVDSKPNAENEIPSVDDQEPSDETLPELEDAAKDEKINLVGLKDSIDGDKDKFGTVADEVDEELDVNLNEDELEQRGKLAFSMLHRILKDLDQAEQELNHASKTLEKVQQKFDASNHRVPPENEVPAENSELEDDANDVSETIKKVSPTQHTIEILQEQDIDQSQRQRLEQAIRQKLEQSGVDTKGKKIELKIVTAEYVGKDDEDGEDEFHITDDVSKKILQHFIMTFYAKNREAAEQVERQRRLEENYRFVWGQNGNKQNDNDDDDNNNNNNNNDNNNNNNDDDDDED